MSPVNLVTCFLPVESSIFANFIITSDCLWLSSTKVRFSQGKNTRRELRGCYQFSFSEVSLTWGFWYVPTHFWQLALA